MLTGSIRAARSGPAAGRAVSAGRIGVVFPVEGYWSRIASEAARLAAAASRSRP